MASVHADEVAIDEVVVRRVVDQQSPGWKDLRLAPAGHGADNRMLRLGGSARRPTATHAWYRRGVAKE